MEIVGEDRIIKGDEIFKLLDTYGLPLDIMCLELRERDLGFNVPEFIEAARKAGWKDKRIKWTLISNISDKEVLSKINSIIPDNE